MCTEKKKIEKPIILNKNVHFAFALSAIVYVESDEKRRALIYLETHIRSVQRFEKRKKSIERERGREEEEECDKLVLENTECFINWLFFYLFCLYTIHRDNVLYTVLRNSHKYLILSSLTFRLSFIRIHTHLLIRLLARFHRKCLLPV